MENARIIKLDMPLTVTSSTFGEAFGEYSELKGRGRAKRQKRRQERRMTRISNRATRKRARQDMRAEQQEARQTRKDTRKSRKVARDEMGAENEEAPESAGDEEQGQPTEQEGAGEGEYETTESEEQNPSEDEESGFNGEYYDNFDAVMSSADGIDYDNLGSSEDIYALQDDDFYSFVDESSSADGFQKRTVRKRIGKGTKNVAMKSEWNKEMVSRLEKRVAAIDMQLSQGTTPEREQMLGIKRAKLVEAITLHKDRAVSFDGLMNDYINAEGDYSGIDGDTSDADGDSSDADGDYDSADGDYENADGEFENADGEFENAIGKRKKRPAKRSKKMPKKVGKKKVGKKKRTAEVKAAKREARKSRTKSRIASKRKQSPIKVTQTTKVSKSLNPEFGKDYIVIPEKEINASSAEGTGLIALDDINDFDAPRENEYSLASGSPLKNVNWKGVLIGVAIAGLAIYGAKKAKLF
jgi:hypothetical protein